MAILLTENCIGCGACYSACLPGCIELRLEKSGFFRAYISEKGCTGCGRCKIVCPQLRSSRSKPESVFAYQNPIQADLSKSQSGGAFLSLARTVIEQGGIVFGVKWNEDCTRAIFSSARTVSELELFTGSKYIPADLSCVLEELRGTIKRGQLTLFCGLPCQVAAIRNLYPNRDNLLLVEVLCMGPMSLTVWEILRRNLPHNLRDFRLRDKRHRGWGEADSRYEFSDGTHQCFCSERFPAWKIFASALTISSSCFNCKFRSFDRVADISIGDFWGIEYLIQLPEEIRQNGISLVHYQTALGKKYFIAFQNGILGRFTDFDKIRKFNGGYRALTDTEKKRQESFYNLSYCVGYRVSVWLASFLARKGRNFPKCFRSRL